MERSSNDTSAADSNNVEQLVDSLVAEFESDWKDGKTPRIEEVLSAADQIPTEVLLPKLIPIELDQLQARNTFPDHRTYYERFPEYTAVIDTVFSHYSNTVPPVANPAESLDTFSFDDTSRTGLKGDNLPPFMSGPGAQLGNVIGDYKILDVLGQGGMGIVYKAYQTSADRVVALKVIRPERLERHSDEQRRQIELRFQTEARAVARLQHDNLLQVYDVGISNGVHYFSMQYVVGKSLSQIIREAPLSNRKAAEYLEKITRAIAEAHRNGVLHRDLKPENILVDTRTDRPLLADFGLAKVLEEDVSATTDGEVFGSPPYMSPEQAVDSASVTVSGDVYSLGATLYCMLTGQPPFKASTPLETLRQVVNVAPRSPRELNPEIDLDLETICLKCLEKEPARRYSTAEALADDLGRYLRREPVLARPVGTLTRFYRACMRNKLITALSSLAVMGALAAFVILAIKNVEVTDALGKAQAAKIQSDIDLVKLREVLDRVSTQFSEHMLLNQPGMQTLRKDLLTIVLPYYEDFVNSNRNTPKMQVELGNAYYRLGSIQELLGALEEGTKAYIHAIDLQEKRRSESPNDPESIRALGQTLNALARVYHKQKRLDDAADMYQTAVERRRDLLALDPEDDESRRQLANTTMNLGEIYRERKAFALAEGQFEEALKLRTGFESLGIKFRRDLSRGYYNWGHLRLDENRQLDEKQRLEQKKLDEAIDFFEQSALLLESILVEDPHSIEDLFSLALCRRLQGDAASELYTYENSTDALKKAIQSDEQALESIQILNLSNPDVPDYLEEYGNIELNLGALLRFQGKLERAESLFVGAKEKFDSLVKKSPQNFNYQFAFAKATKELALTLPLRTDLDDRTDITLKLLEEAKQKFESLQTEFPNQTETDAQLADTKQWLELLKMSNSQPSPKSTDL